MRSTPTSPTASEAPTAPRRSRALPLPETLRDALRAHLAATPPERIATVAEVSVATVYRAAQGRPVRAVVRSALARACTLTPATAA